MREQTGHRLITSPEFTASGGLSQTQQCWESACYRLATAAFHTLRRGELVGGCDCRVLVEAVLEHMDRRVLRANVDADVGEVQSAILPYSPLGEVTLIFFFETSAHGAV